MPLAVAPEWQVKLLTDVLCHCIDKSRASPQLPEPRRKTVVEGLLRQHLANEGSLDLNAVWGAMLMEPGVTERAMASAFAAMEDLDKVLPVPIAPTQRLQALNPVQRQALLGEAPVVRTEIERMLRNARIEAQLAGARAAKIQTSMMPAIGAAPPVMTGASGQQPRLTAALMSIPLMKPGGPDSKVGLPAMSAGQPPGGDGEAVLPPPSGPVADDATKEARLKAARALLERAAVDIQLEAAKGRSGPIAIDPARPRTTGVHESLRSRSTGSIEAISPRTTGGDVRRPAPKTTDPKGKKGPAAKGTAKNPEQRKRLLVASGLLVAGLGVAGAGAYVLLYREPPPAFDVSGLTALRLSDGTAAPADSVQATIADPRWASMSGDARREAVLKTFKQLQGRGVHTLVLYGADHSLQAQAKDNLPGLAGKEPLVLLSGAAPAAKAR